jgi:hypothetical protein
MRINEEPRRVYDLLWRWLCVVKREALKAPAGSHDHRPYPEPCLPALSGARVRAGRGSRCPR